MEKQSFRSLAKQALSRSRDGKLMWLLFIGLLLSIGFALPLLATIAVAAVKSYRYFADGESLPMEVLLWAAPLCLIFYLIALWLSMAVYSGIQREVLYPAPARIGRGLKNGFARIVTVLYQVPWLLLSLIVSVGQSALQRMRAGWPALLAVYVAELAVGMVSVFLYTGISAGKPGIGFGELYANAFRAIKNGWCRMLLGYLAIIGFCIVCVLALLPGTICFALGATRDSMQLKVAGAVLLLAWCLGMILALLKLWSFSLGYFIYLYLDAARVKPEIRDVESSAADESAESAPPESESSR